jgi:NADP-dependent 3-hydroxy acid dehydrogenase YdfG
MSERIEGKVVIVTGASSGIGEAIARRLAKQGARLMLAARRADKLSAILGDIERAGGNAKAFTVDVTDERQVGALIESTLAAFGRVDVLVNNAGYMALAPMGQRRTREWDRMIDINIKGMLYGISAALPVFQRQGSGHFVNTASVAGFKVFPGGAVYSATKFAVRAVTEGLRMEAGSKIRVTMISPGAVASELAGGVSDEASKKAIDEFLRQAIPPDAIARAVAYAIEQPPEVDVNEIVVRPTSQEF